MIKWGNVPVPNTASWSGEEAFTVGSCRYFGGKPALMQTEAQGAGKPIFSKPHSQRQREAIARCLCNLCGKAMKMTTKVSLSHARPQPHGAQGWAILQVEPMLHRACAALSLRHCPSLQRDIARGSLFVRRVTRWRAQCAIMSAEYVESITGRAVKALGHAKVELLDWNDESADWLLQGLSQ